MAEWQWKRWDAVARVEAGKLTTKEAASLLGLSARQLRRVRRRLAAQGRQGLVHGNQGGAPANLLMATMREQIVVLRREKYRDFNDQHFTEKLATEGVGDVSVATVRRLLRAAGIGPMRRPRLRPRLSCRGSEPDDDSSTTTVSTTATSTTATTDPSPTTSTTTVLVATTLPVCRLTNCDDGDPCTLDGCDEEIGCVSTPDPRPGRDCLCQRARETVRCAPPRLASRLGSLLEHALGCVASHAATRDLRPSVRAVRRIVRRSVRGPHIPARTRRATRERTRFLLA